MAQHKNSLHSPNLATTTVHVTPKKGSFSDSSYTYIGAKMPSIYIRIPTIKARKPSKKRETCPELHAYMEVPPQVHKWHQHSLSKTTLPQVNLSVPAKESTGATLQTLVLGSYSWRKGVRSPLTRPWKAFFKAIQALSLLLLIPPCLLIGIQGGI